MTKAQETLLTGLDGSNSLAFLAALGTLRAVTRLDREARLAWTLAAGWRPLLQSHLGRDELPPMLHEELARMAAVPWPETETGSGRVLARNITLSVAEYRDWARSAPAGNEALHAEWAASLATDGAESGSGTVRDTALRTMSGVGHQHFLESFRLLAETTSHEQLEEALFGPWRYEDEQPFLRWDPFDDRRHALRWKNPSKDPGRTVRGANRLALEALPLFPVVPVANDVRTVGFTSRKEPGVRRTATWWTWPIWETPLSLDATRTLLALPDLQFETVERERLRLLGVSEIFRAQRLTVDKYRNFTPAASVGSRDSLLEERR